MLATASTQLRRTSLADLRSDEARDFPGTGAQKMRYLRTAQSSCGLRRTHPLRQFLLRLTLADWFEVVTTIVTLANTVLLSLYQPTEPPTAFYNALLERSSVVFCALFTAELVTKVAALGLWGGQQAYLSDRWNWLDAAVVALSWMSLSPRVQNVSSLRLLRLLRTLNAFTGFRVVLHAILHSVSALMPVLMLALLFIVVFALVGLQLWAGVLSGVCGYSDPGTGEWRWSADAQPCALPCSDFADGECTPTFGDACPTSYQAVSLANGTGMVRALVAMTCRRSQNPDFGQTSFDHIGYALLSSFWAYTTEGWSAVAAVIGRTW